MLLILLATLLPFMAAPSGSTDTPAEMKLAPALKPLYRELVRQTTSGKSNPDTLNQAQHRFAQMRGARHLNAGAYLPLIVHYSGDIALLEQVGFQLRSKRGSFVTGTCAVDDLPLLTALAGVTAIEPSNIMHRPIRLADIEPNSERPHRAVGKQRTSGGGAGVLVAYVDSGADIYHHDFRHSDGSSRILYYLDFSAPGDGNGDLILDGDGPFGATLYTKADIDAALDAKQSLGPDCNGHGTHGLSIAAGDDAQWPGTAPEADLIVVKATREDGSLMFESIDVIDALHFIDEKAAELGMPYVVNLSFSTLAGAHNGLSLQERAIDALVGPGIPGKAVVVSAGNASDNGGDTYRHIEGVVFPGVEQASNRHTLIIPNYTPHPGPGNDAVLLELWYDGSDQLALTVKGPDGRLVLAADYGEPVSTNSPFGHVYIGNFGGGSVLEDMNRAVIIIDDQTGAAPAVGTWTIEVRGQEVQDTGRYHGWLNDRLDVGGQAPYLGPGADNRYLVGSPGNAHNVITVGSHAADAGRFITSWTNISGIHMNDPTAVISNISPFSSPGPTRDGRLKPELTAPGQWVVGALSRDAMPGLSPHSIYHLAGSDDAHLLVLDDTQERAFAVHQGTSFAAPTVTGLVARLLAIQPNLDAVQLRNLLIKSSTDHEGIGNPVTGFGRVNLSLAEDGSLPDHSLRIATRSLPRPVEGRPYNSLMAASGGVPPHTWGAETNLPSGLRLRSSGQITGTPTRGGNWTTTLRVTDALGQIDRLSVQLDVQTELPLNMKQRHLPLSRLELPFRHVLAAEHGLPPYTWSIVGGALPAGVTLSEDGVLAGTPELRGIYPITLELKDQTGAAIRRSFRFHIVNPGGDDWRFLPGLEANFVRSIALDPNDPQRVLAGTRDSLADSVMMTTNGGESWQPFHTFSDINTVAINPITGTPWRIAGGRLHRVSDESWPFLNIDCSTWSIMDDLAFDPSGTMYLLVHRACAGGPSGSEGLALLVSHDDGLTWEQRGQLPGSVWPCAEVSPTYIWERGSLSLFQSDPSIMYATIVQWCDVGAPPSNEKTYRSNDGGRTWIDITQDTTNSTEIIVSQQNPLDVVKMPFLGLFGTNESYIERTTDGGETWQRHDIPGGRIIYALARSESHPDILVAGTWYGPFKSINAGETWTRLDFPVPRGWCCKVSGTIAIHPIDPNLIYVGTASYGIFKSEDGGVTWQSKNYGFINRGIGDLAVNPLEPNKLLLKTTDRNLYVSNNSGEQWTRSVAGIFEINKGSFPIISQQTPDQYFVVQRNFYRSDNAGLTWEQVNDMVLDGEPYTVGSLTIDPFDDQIFLARLGTGQNGLGDNTGIWRSEDQGETWFPVSDVANSVRGGTVMFAQDVRHRVYARGSDGIYRSSDSGLTWQLVAPDTYRFVPAPSNSDYIYRLVTSHKHGVIVLGPDGQSSPPFEKDRITALAVSPTDPKTAMVAVTLLTGFEPQLFKTTDAGQTWRAVAPNLRVKVAKIVYQPNDPMILYAGGEGHGFYRSVDGGETFQRFGNFSTIAGHVHFTLQDPGDPNRIYAATRGFGVQISNDGGETFEPTVTGLTSYNVNRLAFDQGSPSILYAGTDSGLFKSIDGGATWTATSITEGIVEDIVIREGDRPRRIYVVSKGRGSGFSDDEGVSFKFTSEGLTSLDLTSIHLIGPEQTPWVSMKGGDGVAYSPDQGHTWLSASGNGLSSRQINDLIHEAGTPGRIWAASDDGVFYSDNHGVSWFPRSAGLPPDVPATSLAIDPTNGELLVGLYSETAGGVFRGGNLGAFWRPMSNGLNGLKVEHVGHGTDVVSRGEQVTTLFASTAGAGVFTATRSYEISPAPTIQSESLPDAETGANYHQELFATGGTPPYQWHIIEGEPPAGLYLNVDTGIIGGQPTTLGLTNFTVQVTDSDEKRAQAGFTLEIKSRSAPVFTGRLYDRQIPFGERHTLTVAAKGSEPITYRWYKDGMPLEAVGSTLNLLPNSMTDSGVYYCQATNLYGVTTSETVTIKIDLPVSWQGSYGAWPYADVLYLITLQN